MDDDLPLETACAHPLHQAAGHRRDGGIGHAQPEDIGLKLGAVRGWRGNDDLVQRNPGQLPERAPANCPNCLVR